MEAETLSGIYPLDAFETATVTYFAVKGTTYKKGNILHISGTSGSVKLGEPIPTSFKLVAARDLTVTAGETLTLLPCWRIRPGQIWWCKARQTGGRTRYGDLAVLTAVTANKHRLAVQSQQGAKAHVRIVKRHPDDEASNNTTGTDVIWLISMTPTVGL